MRRVLSCVIGQSNEQGFGEVGNVNVGFGAPSRDPVAPNGQTAKRSMWPYLAQLMGARGTWLSVYNTAVGSTSIAESWTGHCRTWASGMSVIAGSYVLSDGKLWRVTNDGSAAQYTCTVAPTGTANVTTADVPTNIPWTYIGSPGAADVDGHVYSDGETHFDPLGYMAAMAEGLSSAVGYNEKWVFLSIGQGDASLETSRTVYGQGIISAVNYALSSGADKVFIGFTCYSGADAWYTSDLLPGRQDALDYFANDSRVKEGANLREALGVLDVSPALPTTPGLQADGAHMNDAAYDLASEAWRDAICAAL